MEILLDLVWRSDMLLHMKKEPPVVNRLYMSAKERAARSRLAKLVHDYQLLRGGLVTMAHGCGKPGCRCARGHKHVSLYLAARIGSKRKMIYIPKHLERTVRSWVEVYQESNKLSREISTACLERFLKKKRAGSEPHKVAGSKSRFGRGRRGSGRTKA